MNIKDIMNRDLVNLTNCEDEPIHIPGSIQPHGFLLGLNTNDGLRIEFCSGNISDYFQFEVGQVLNKSFQEVFGAVANHRLQNLFTEAQKEPITNLDLRLFEQNFKCSYHFNGSYYILEAELAIEELETTSDLYNQTIRMVSYMNNTDTIQELCAQVAQGTREITGYDRVMIYRFDSEYNGEVIAESCRDDIESFLGLHYPSTDIPEQARVLYLKNLVRLIPDVGYDPVPIFTSKDSDNTFDMSHAVLRSTSPIHVQYLHNMGVNATLTISLIHRGRLWGLVACHHYSAKNLSPSTRLAAQLQGLFITSQIDVRQSNEEYKIARKSNIALERLNALNLPPLSESFKIISVNPDLLKICNASGVSIVVDGVIYKNGITPADEDIWELSAFLSEYSNNGAFFTDKIINFLPEFKIACKSVSGLIYHSLAGQNNIIWYRPETISEKNWAGDPNKSIIKDDNGLHPRKSFQIWQEVIHCKSRPWVQPEINAAANYAHALEKQIGMLIISQEEEKYRNLSELLKETNAELENINWISTHDLQEPLRKIQMISSRMLTMDDVQGSERATHSLVRMNRSANQMQTLLIDILKYTNVQNTDEAFENLELNHIFEDVLSEFEDQIERQEAIVEKMSLPSIHGIRFLVKQLFLNIISNSLKFASPDRKPLIYVTVSDSPISNYETKGQLCHKIDIADNGIGFDGRHSNSIFKIFSRLQHSEDIGGSGVGLALCKKIMKTHNGYISAKPGDTVGSVFTLYFPVK